jgi:uncharacterized protein YwgA
MQNWLKLLEILGSKAEFEGAVKLHKIAYLAQSLGLAPSEAFAWHLYGPYAPSLALRVDELRDMDALEVTKTVPGAPDKFRLTEVGKALRNFLRDREGENLALENFARQLHDEWSREELEIAASVEYLVRHGRMREQAIEEMSQLKPQFGEAAVRAAVEKLDALRAEVERGGLGGRN